MRVSQNPNPTALETVRRAAGLSRKKLGEISGINFRTIEAYEQRKLDINIASVSIVRALAMALNVPMEEILDDVPTLPEQAENKK